MTCHDAESLLHDALDRALAAPEAAVLATHLETCAACRDLQADLALVREASAALDRPVVPADGWRTLATRLEAEGLLVAASASAAPRPTAWRTYTFLAIAATLLAGVGAALMWRATERATPPTPIVKTLPEAGGNARDPQAVEAIETELTLAAEHYEKAVVALEKIANVERARLDPAVAAVVGRNLVLIDTAIADSRRALQGQPGSLVAQESLFDAYRRKVTLLQDVIALAGEVQRSGNDGTARPARGQS